MDVLRNLWSRMTSLVAAGKGARLLWAGLLAILVVAGGVWMIWPGSRDDMVPAMDGWLAGQRLSAAVELLEGRGIVCGTDGGQVLVAPEAAARARNLLAAEGLADDRGPQFEQFIGGDDLWTTQAQSLKRWQAAKMATLSRLIGSFPSVRSAVVLFEPGKDGKLGRSGTKATAAVHVGLADSSEMTAPLVGAIADMVAGSIANLDRQDVCVIDSRGRSYRAGDESLAAAQAVARQRRFEEYYERKIAVALAYLGNVTVAVHLDEARQPKCTGVALAVPRSYFRAVAAGDEGPVANDIAGVIASESDRIRQMVMRVVGGLDAANVTVDCYYDVSAPPVAKIDDHGTSAAGGAWPAARSWASLLLAVGGAFCWWVLIRRRRRRVAGQVVLPETQPVLGEADGAAPAGGGEDQREAAHPLAFLADVPQEDLARLVEGQEAQSIAVVVSLVSRERAAAILAALEPQRQEQVIRRLVGLGEVDAATTAAVAESLAARLNDCRGAPPDVLTTIAEILDHTGDDTEKSILDGLSQSQPHLAWSIRRRLLAFEDIVRVPADRLCEALVSLEPHAVALALRTAGDEVRSKVLRSLPAGQARSVRRRVARIGPVRLSEIEAAQQHVAAAVRRFAAERAEPASAEMI